MAAAERRRFPRYPLLHPVKLCCVQTGRYFAGRLENLSANGALVTVQHPSLLVAGQRLKLAVGWSARQMLIAAADMLDATVVRSLGSAGGQYVAVQFDEAQPMAATG